MKQGRGKRTISLLLVLALCLSLLPGTALAGGNFMEMICFDNNRLDEYSNGTRDGKLAKDADGTIRFSVSGGKPLTGPCTITSVWFVDADTLEEKYDLLSSAYGGTDNSLVDSYTDQETNELTYFLSIWIENLVIPNAAAGDYRLRVVTSQDTYYSEAYVDEYYSTDGIAHIVEDGTVTAKPTITTASLPSGYAEEAYTAALEGTSTDNSTLTWSLVSGSLPQGLTLNGETGVISGTPTGIVTSSFTVKAVQQNGEYREAVLTIVIGAPKTYTVRIYPNGGQWTDDSGAYVKGDYSSYTRSGIRTGTAVTLPAAPTLWGYDFAGWEYDGAVYQPGASFTVTENVRFTGTWESKPDVIVTLPKLGDLVGSVTLVGLYQDGEYGEQETNLWCQSYYSPRSLPESLSFSFWNLYGHTFTALELRAEIDGADTVIARCDGPVTAESGTVALTATENAGYTLVTGFTVTGMTEGQDYAYYQVRREGNSYVHIPFLTDGQTAYTVTVSGNVCSANYAPYDWTVVYPASILSDGRLSVTLSPMPEPDVALHGTVTLQGAPLSGAKVTVSQYYKGVSRTHSTTTGSDGSYTLYIYPTAEAYVSVSSGGQKMNIGGGEYLQNFTHAADLEHNINVNWALLRVDITLEDPLAVRYLDALQSYILLTAENGGQQKDWFSLYLSEGRYTQQVQLYNTTSVDGTLTCTLSRPGMVSMEKEAVLSEGVAEVSFEPAVVSGVLVPLSAAITGNYLLAWYDSQGSFIGRTSPFYLSPWKRDVAAVCPAETKTGTFTVVLVPATYSAALPDTVLSGLTEDQCLNAWSVTLTENRVTELEAYTVDAYTSKNALYVTLPFSTLHAEQESFADTTDLLAFTGTIGLDAGLQNGRLRGLRIMTAPEDYRDIWDEETNTAICYEVVINGKSYGVGTTVVGGCNVALGADADKIELPCEYTVYCKAAHNSRNVHVEVLADVSYNNNGYTVMWTQLVGTANVARPGATISTLSPYVSGTDVRIKGTAKPGEEVSIYDNGEYVGSAVGDDRFGIWSAQVPLTGTHSTYVTSHRLTAVTASGVTSDELLVLHCATAPELASFTMSWNGNREIAVGDAYVYTGCISQVTFRAVFLHPEMLETLTEWGSNVQAVFKVYTSDGAIRFLPAQNLEGVYTAMMGTTLWAAVIKAEVIYVPKDLPTAVNADTRVIDVDGSAAAQVDELWASYAESMGEDYMTMAELTAAVDANGDALNYTILFDGQDSTPVFSGAYADLDPEDEDVAAYIQTLSDAAEVFKKAGITLRSLQLVCGDSTMDTWSWLRAVSEVASKENAEGLHKNGASVASAVRLYRSRADLQAVEDSVRELVESDETGSAQLLCRSQPDENKACARYVFFDPEHDEDPESDTFCQETSITHQITLTYCYDDVNGVYTEKIDAVFYEEYILPDQVDLLAATGTEAKGLSLLTAGRGEGGGLRLLLSEEPFFLKTKYGDTPDPAAEQRTFSAHDFLDGIGKGTANAFQKLGLGGTANSGALSANAIELFNLVKLSKVGSAIGYIAGILGIPALLLQYYQHLELQFNLHMDVYEMLKRVVTNPCFKKLTALQKMDIAKEVLSHWYLYSAGKYLISGFNGLVSTYVTYINTMAMLTGIPGAIKGASKAFLASVAKQCAIITTITTCGAMSVDAFCQQMMKELDEKSDLTAQKTEAKIQSIMRNAAVQRDDRDCMEGQSTAGDDFIVTHDPTGIVYEGVIENPVEGAKVTLYYAVDGEGDPLQEANAGEAGSLIPAGEVQNLVPAEAIQFTGEDGRYQWGVPEGLWFVTAEYGGLTGDSGADSAATVAALGRKLLPVLPVQLNVNIPLTDPAAPMVTDVQYTKDGVYVTFSKYMTEGAGADSVLNAANYGVYRVSEDTELTVSAIISEKQGHVPANIDPNETTYTRTVFIKTAEPLDAGTALRVTVSGTVTSYAGTPLGETYNGFGTAEEMPQLAAPVLSLASGQVERASALTITAAAGAEIYYTTDGSEPTTESKLYSGPIVVTNDVTVKAIAVAVGCKPSAAATGTYTVAVSNYYTVSAAVTASDGGDVSGLTFTLEGTDFSRTGHTGKNGVLFLGVPAGSYTLSFAGNDRYQALSRSVEVGEGKLNLELTLTSKGAPETGTLQADTSTLTLRTGQKASLTLTLTTDGETPAAGESIAAAAAAPGIASVTASAVTGADGKAVFTVRGVTAGSTVITFTAGDRTAVVELTVTERAPGYQPPVPTPSAAPAAEVEAEGGSVEVTPAGARSGDTVTVTVTPEPGYEVESISVVYTENGSDVSVPVTRNDDGTYSYLQPDKAVQIRVTYQPTRETMRETVIDAFTDVTADTPNLDAVAWAFRLGLMVGYGDGTFGPEDDLTRAQTVTVLWRLTGRPKVDGELGFTDVFDPDYIEAIKWARASGIVEGYSPTLFGPNDPVNREQLAAMVYRYAAWKELDLTVTGDPLAAFTDREQVSGWALTPVAWCLDRGVLYPLETEAEVQPRRIASRSEVALTVMDLDEDIQA